MKANQVKAERTIILAETTCIVCGKKTRQPYGLLRRGYCVCTSDCSDRYLKGEYRHE